MQICWLQAPAEIFICPGNFLLAQDLKGLQLINVHTCTWDCILQFEWFYAIKN